MWRTQATCVALVAAVWLSGCAEAGWPLCKQRCDSSYDKEQLLEHPGVASVCHRGCELFTVALIATPHGGLPLLEQKLTWAPNPVDANLEPKLTSLLKGSSKETELKIIEAKPRDKKETGKLEKNEVKKEVNKASDKHKEKLQSVTEKMEKKKTEIKERIEAVRKQKQDEKEKKNSVDQQSVKSNDKKMAPNQTPKASTFLVTREMLKPHQQHIQFIKPFSPPYSTALKPGILKIPIKIMEGAPAKQILADARQAEEPVVIESSKSHGPVHIATLTLNPPKPQEDVHKKNKASKIESKKVPHGPVSKTTVQPASHPVQDHPVHASRQITTDSSGAEERKTTTPQSSNPSLPLDHKIPEFDIFAKLANKLGSSVKKDMHPIIRVSIDEPKTIGIFPAPQQISIIEIIKKKNNIDFEKLHQEHMADAVHCPMILERFEEAKHSCRQACKKAYSAHKEQDACAAGCQLQASSSTDQVRSQLSEGGLSGPEGVFSAIRQVFSSIASHIGLGGATEPFFPRGFGATELKSVEVKQPSHVGFEVYIEKTGPRTVQKKIMIGPKGRVIDTETIVQVSGHGSPLTQGQMMHEQLESHKKMVHQEMEVQGKLLAEDPSNVELELNRQLEIMGKHLTEDAQKVGGEHPFFQPFFSQFLFPRMSIKTTPELEPTQGKAENNAEKHVSSLFENLFPFPSSFTELRRKNDKKNKGVEGVDDLTFRTNSVMKSEMKLPDAVNVDNQKPESRGETAEGLVPVQQLDLLDCISRKSGLPHWLIVFSLYTSVLVVFWLCFLLYAYVVELKECKNKASAVVCEAGEPLLEDCCETKALLPDDDCYEVRVKTV